MPLTTRQILAFWLPLLASWLLMTTEGPLLSAVINRLPDEVVMLAAMGIVFALAVAIESPIINLLATATALVRDHQSFLQVRRFTVHWMVGLTVVAAALAATPLFGLVVGDLLGTPPEVARWVRRGLLVLVPWSAAIAWRRFHQGVLIAFGRPREVAAGTVVRLIATGGTAIGLALATDLVGVEVGSIGLVTGVIAEAIYATVAVRPLLRWELSPERPQHEPLGYRELAAFHLPLASTSVLTLLAQPLITAALARVERPVPTLAAWPLVFQFLLFARASALALPEVIIALGRREGSRAALRRFSFGLAAATAVGMALFAWTPVALFYLIGLQSAEGEVVGIAARIFAWTVPLPALAVLISWWRGRLILLRHTHVVNHAMALRLAATVALLAAAVAARWSGVATAAVALVVPLMVEVAVLAWRSRSLDR